MSLDLVDLFLKASICCCALSMSNLEICLIRISVSRTMSSSVTGLLDALCEASSPCQWPLLLPPRSLLPLYPDRSVFDEYPLQRCRNAIALEFVQFDLEFAFKQVDRRQSIRRIFRVLTPINRGLLFLDHAAQSGETEVSQVVNA